MFSSWSKLRMTLGLVAIRANGAFNGNPRVRDPVLYRVPGFSREPVMKMFSFEKGNVDVIGSLEEIGRSVERDLSLVRFEWLRPRC